MTWPMVRRNFNIKLVKVTFFSPVLLTTTVPLACYEPLAIHYKEQHTISVIRGIGGVLKIRNVNLFIKAFLPIHKVTFENEVNTFM